MLAVLAVLAVLGVLRVLGMLGMLGVLRVLRVLWAGMRHQTTTHIGRYWWSHGRPLNTSSK